MIVATAPPGEFERAVLEIVDQGDGRFGWREIAVRLAIRDAPRQDELSEVLGKLVAVGLLVRVEGPRGSDQWVLTGGGSAGLAPAAEDGTDPLATALAAGLEETLAAIQPLTDDPAALETALRRGLEKAPETARGVAVAALCLPGEARDALVHEVSCDARPVARRALYGAWAPTRMEAPGDGWRPLPEEAWDPLLRRGLADPDPEVRIQATALVFSTARGAGLVDELLANLDTCDRRLRRRTILALGSADDQRSFEVLRAIFLDGDADEAGDAVRALAARTDGRGDWRAALGDRRETVRGAAVFALARVVEGLGEQELTALESSPRTELAAAAGACRARTQGADA